MPAFITVEDLSDMLGRDVTSDDGAQIAVSAACDICRTIAEQQFTAGTTTATLDGSGTDALVLPERPVGTVGTVTVNGAAVTDYALADNGCLFRLAGTATWSTGYKAWPRGRQNVTVTYTHGYGTADIPNDVRAVALAAAQRLAVQGVAVYETVGQTSIRYAGAATDLTAGERAILEKYRSITSS